MRVLTFLFLLMLLAGAAFAQKDTLLFKNGSIIIGEVKKIQLGVITFDPDDANDITVQLRKLASINAANKYFRIETVDHQVIFGKLNRNVNPGFVNVSFGTDTTSIPLSNISNLYPVEKSFRERLTGTAGAGYSYTRSSELGRLNLDLSGRYATEKMEYTVSASTIATIDSGYVSRDNEDVSLGASYYFDQKWFGWGALSYQRNIELGINTRLQEALGLGNKLLLTRNLRLMAFSGFVFNEEKSTEDVYSGLLTEGILGLRFNVFRFEKPELDIQTSQFGYFSFMQERIRYSGDISITWEMVEDLDLKLSFYSDYDSKPPGKETANIDFGTVISIAFEF